MLIGDYRTDWFAPEALPFGGLMQSSMHSLHVTNNLKANYEIYCFHDSPHYFIDRLKERGLEIPDSFIESIKDRARNFVAKGSGGIPTLEEKIEIWTEAYTNAGGSTPDAIEIIQCEIIRFEEERRLEEDRGMEYA